jgi:hypothetical protein
MSCCGACGGQDKDEPKDTEETKQEQSNETED